MLSSVKVPVLSKTKVLIRAARFTLIGEMQKICAFFSLCTAKRVPTAKAAGRAGGIVIVNIFTEQSRIKIVSYPF